MRSSRRLRLMAGTVLSVLCAFVMWSAPSLTAQSAARAANKKIVAAHAKARPTAKRETLRAGQPVEAVRSTGRRIPGAAEEEGEFGPRGDYDGQQQEDQAPPAPREERMERAQPFDGDLRNLPQTDDAAMVQERPERELPIPVPTFVDDLIDATLPPPATIAALAPAPAPASHFDGLDFATWGQGHPPDTVGDVGPEYFVQSINTSVGIFRKSTGALVTAFRLNALMSQGHFGNLCDTNNFGDPVVLYHTFDDRWLIIDFAFRQDSGGNVVNPPGSFQCFAVSKSSDPVAGGWNFYSINTTAGFGDYPKFGVWPDGIYMSANMFGFANGAPFQAVKVFALNKEQMYAGAQSAQIVSFDMANGDSTILPANARLQAGTPPAGTPDYYMSTSRFTNALSVYRFHVDWDRPLQSTFTGPDVIGTGSAFPNVAPAAVPSQGGNNLDALAFRGMMQLQYSRVDGAQSLWATHTVRRANTTGFGAPRWCQVNVADALPVVVQATTWDPDAANVIHRFIPSLAVDRAGNMALGYSTSSSTTKPALKSAGRPATDPINTFGQSEQVLVQGTGTQTGNCGGAPCTRWGDYAAMTLDPDGCTFWFTSMYYKVDGLDHQTHIGAFGLPACTPIGQGALQGTVRASGSPIAGVTVSLGARTATTDANGFYAFANLPARHYPTLSAGGAGYLAQSIASVDVAEGATTVRDFSLTGAALTGCFVDTTQDDFQSGIATIANCDVTSSPGDIKLLRAEKLDQQNLTVTNSGFAFNNVVWAGQTFTPAVSAELLRVELNLFCSGCTGTTPNLTVSTRAPPGTPAVPTGPDLAMTTMPGFNGGGITTLRSAAFAVPATLVAGTRYAVIIRPTVNPSAGVYAYVCSCGNPAAGTVDSNPYVDGQRVTSGNSGGLWAADAGGRDLGFRIFMNQGFAGPGTFVSSLKDANPAAGFLSTWGNLAWNASIPEGTSVTLHVAASNSPVGPFDFLGPDGTAATSFTNGASLAQFNGKRFLRYRATLNTTSGAVTPTLQDVTICFADQIVTALSTDGAGDYGGTATLTARLVGAGAGVPGKTIAFTVNGASVGSATTDASGVATLGDISVAGRDAGTHLNAVTASFAGDAAYTSSTASGALTLRRAPLTVKADDKSKLLNAPNPALTGNVIGVVNGDAITAAYATVANTTTPVGSYPIVPTVVDPASRVGNYDVSIVNGALTIGYSGGGSCLGAPGHQVLSPLSADGTTHKQNSTIPVKFRVCDANGLSVGPTSVVSSFLLQQIVQAGVVNSVNQAPVSTNGDSTFRWDASDQQWIFNLSTKNLSAGAIYVYRIALADGSSIVFRITLR